MAEKRISALPPDLRRLYTRGDDAFHRDNLDYAIDLFNQVLAREPALYECRKSLRTAQLKKVGAGGGGFFKKMLSGASSQPMLTKAQLALRGHPAEAMAMAEQILNGDPNNAAAHRILVEAAKQLELPRTAVLSLEVLFHNSPKDKHLAIQLANGLAEIGEPQRGEQVLVELYRQFPTDNDLAQALKDLSARKTLDEGGYEALADGQGSYRDILKDKDQAVALEQENRQIKTEDATENLIRQYEARLANEPRNLKLVRDLAELYTQKKQFERALQYYAQLKASDLGNDAGLDKSITDTKLRQIDHEISQLDTSVPEHAERAAVLQAERQAFQLAEAQKRVERFPTDLQFRFELGQLYFQLGKISEAIQELQKAQTNPQRRIASMNLLAQCFIKRRMFDLAARRLEEALKEKPVFDDEKKELIYNLGCVLEQMGKKAEAIEQLKLIYEADIGYKDVAAKVESFYSSQ